MTFLDDALALAERGFHVFPVKPGAKEPPLIRAFPEKAARDGAKIRQWWTRWPDANIGVSTTQGLLVVDVDPRHGGAEALAELELTHELPPTFTVRTPSGGQHLYYAVPEPVRQGAGVLGPGLDVRSRGGYVLGPGSVIEAGTYEIVNDVAPVAAPAWLVRKLTDYVHVADNVSSGPTDQEWAQEQAIAFLRQQLPGRAGARNDTAYRLAARLRDFGLDEEGTHAALKEFWRCEPPLRDDELAAAAANAYQYAQNPPGAANPLPEFEAAAEPGETKAPGPIEQLNKEYAWAAIGREADILWETIGPDGSPAVRHLSEGTFHRKLASRRVLVDDKPTAITKLWLQAKERRSYDGVCFDPSGRAPGRYFNLWRGFTVEPAASADHPAVALLLEHVRENICNGVDEHARWVLSFFAHMIQRPWEKPQVALVLRGAKGVGKNVLLDCFGLLVRHSYLVAGDRRYLTSNFNSHLESLLLFVLDEAFWSGDKQAESALKNLVTGKNHVIERKGAEPYNVANLARIAILGNEEWLVPASYDERRFAVFDVGDGRKQDREFFRALVAGMAQGGAEALMRFLFDYDISAWDFAEAPATEGLVRQKLESLDPVAQWWYDALVSDGFAGEDYGFKFGENAGTAEIRHSLTRYFQIRRITARLPSAVKMGCFLREMRVERRRARRGADNRDRLYVYAVPALADARAVWAQRFGGIKWDAADD